MQQWSTDATYIIFSSFNYFIIESPMIIFSLFVKHSHPFSPIKVAEYIFLRSAHQSLIIASKNGAMPETMKKADRDAPPHSLLKWRISITQVKLMYCLKICWLYRVVLYVPQHEKSRVSPPPLTYCLVPFIEGNVWGK